MMLAKSQLLMRSGAAAGPWQVELPAEVPSGPLLSQGDVRRLVESATGPTDLLRRMSGLLSTRAATGRSRIVLTAGQEWQQLRPWLLELPPGGVRYAIQGVLPGS